jgi:hypothetical protein
MTFVSDLKHYNDIRRQVPFEVFRAASGYISWHNRLTMTPMLEVWEALVVSLVYQRKPIDELMFGAVKSFLGRTGDSIPETIEDCRDRADELISILFPEP